jgi:hypothetical protein
MAVCSCGPQSQRAEWKHVAGEALRVHPHHHVLAVADLAPHEREVRLTVEQALVREEAEVAEVGRQGRHAHPPHQTLVLHPIADEVGDRDDRQPVPPREPQQLGHPRHAAVLVHDLADHAGRVQARHAGQIDGGLGVTAPHQHAAVACAQRKTCPGRARSDGRVFGSMAARTVAARSDAETPVLVPLASIGTHIGVSRDDELTGAPSGMSRASSRSGSIARQTSPRPCVTMKFTISG